MASKAKHVVSILLVVSLALILAACIGHWFTPPQIGKLIVGPPVPKDGQYEVLISVADMPDGGVAGVQLGSIAQPAIEFSNNVDVSTVTAEGLNGFRVTAQGYTAGPPVEGSLIAVYGGVALESGQVLKLTFEATGDPTVTLDDTRIDLASAAPAWVAGWDLVTDVAYYTKEAALR
jgi:hypothetical protein